MLLKLSAYQFHPMRIDWIKDWLMDRVSVVSVNGLRSKEFGVCSGVPQGSVLGPLLLMFLVSSIPECIKFSNVIMYADDIILDSRLTKFTLSDKKHAG